MQEDEDEECILRARLLAKRLGSTQQGWRGALVVARGPQDMSPPGVSQMQENPISKLFNMLTPAAWANVRAVSRMTSLTLARRLGFSEVEEKLMADGIQPEIASKITTRASLANGETVVVQPRVDMFHTRLRVEIKHGREDKADEFVALTASAGALDNRDEHGQTLLMLSSKMGSERMVLALVAAGARAELVDEQNRTSLMLAIANGQDETAKALVAPTVKAGVDLDLRDERGRSGLMVASTKGLTAAVEAMVAVAVTGASGSTGNSSARCICPARAPRWAPGSRSP